MQHVFLKKGRERPVLNGHPWIFSGAIERVEDGSDAAGVTDVLDSGGRWLARGLYNPRSQIRVRLLTWQEENIDQVFLTRRLSQAAALRKQHLSASCGAYRLVNGEGDFLPGLVVDRYGDFLVGQFFTAGMDSLRGTVVDALAALFPAMGIYERSEGGVREEEGLIPSVGVLRGEEPPDLLQIEEHQLKFLVDIRKGQKTGFFLDQRENRLFLSMLARDKAILNCFAYTGAFTAYALRGGARQVLSIESSRPALDLARQNLDLNGLSVSGGELVKADAFSYLKYCKDQFDIVVVDPPSLALKRADVQPAAGSYKFLNLHALRLLKPGGMLLTFCCSQHVSLDLFQKIIFGAAADSGRKVRLLNRLGHPVDHPVSLHHPEGEYLKGLLLSVLE
ncbi:MAG: class I SAM-dependent rRNA methyltransferase [Deltaproteobacteria bacterium]|nr:class I SAM-dependent rRNA methyltransferase [Deltaproteobacteria bacterium]